MIRRRLFLILAFLLGVPASVRAQAGPPVKSSPLVLDVRDYGDDPQAAIDALDVPHIVRLPGRKERYGNNEPIWLDKNFVTLEGDRDLTTVSPILVGLRRVPLSPDTGKPQRLNDPLTPYTFDALPLLDGSITSTWTALWLRGDSHLVGKAVPLALGPKGGWSAVETIVIEWAQQVDPAYPNGTIMGLFGDAADSTNPSPFRIKQQDGAIDWDWRTGDGQRHGLRIKGPAPDSKGVVRYSLQMSPKAGTAQVYANGVQVAWQPEYSPMIPGQKFAENMLAHFAVGGAGRLEIPDTAQGLLPDLRILGLRIVLAPLYADDGAGKPQRRLDGKPVTDNSRLTNGYDSPVLLDFLRLDLPAADMTARRRVWTWPSSHYLLWLSTGHGNVNTAPVEGTRLRNLTVRTANNLAGAAVLAGMPLHLVAEGCTFSGGGAGWAGIAASANYKYTFRDDTFECLNDSGTAWELYFAIAQAENIRIRRLGRYGILASMCDFECNGLYSDGNDGAAYAFASPKNAERAKYTFRNWNLDFEGAGVDRGVFLFAASSLAPAVHVRLEDIVCGVVGSDAAFVELRGYVGAPAYWHDSTFVGDGLSYIPRDGKAPLLRIMGAPGKASRWVGRATGYGETPKLMESPDGMPATISAGGFGAQQAPAPQPAPEPPPQGRKARFELLRRAS
jgi:hypothetical protein